MLYTRKGDDGKTCLIGGQAKTFGCDQRLSKSSAIAEALGAMDETNSILGVVRARLAVNDTNILMGTNDANKEKEKNSKNSRFTILDSRFEQILLDVQQNLFIIQAELAGAEGKTMSKEKLIEIEKLIDAMEKELPPIKTFFIPGATEIGAMFDVARTISRRAERRVVAVAEAGDRKIGTHSLAYLNRLSSLLYALARYTNYKLGAEEKPPTYK